MLQTLKPCQSWWQYLRRPWAKANSYRLARAAVAQLGFPWAESHPGIWSAAAPAQQGYPIRLDLFVEEELVVCMARAAIDLDDLYIQRQLAIRLLVLNNGYVYGSNRLLEGPDGLSIVHCLACESHRYSVDDLAEVGRILIGQMRELVMLLCTEELIMPQRERTPQSQRD